MAKTLAQEVGVGGGEDAGCACTPVLAAHKLGGEKPCCWWSWDQGGCAVPVRDVDLTALRSFSKPLSLISRLGMSLNPLKHGNWCRQHPAAKWCVSPGGYTSVLQSPHRLFARRWMVVRIAILNDSPNSKGNKDFFCLLCRVAIFFLWVNFIILLLAAPTLASEREKQRCVIAELPGNGNCKVDEFFSPPMSKFLNKVLLQDSSFCFSCTLACPYLLGF